MKKKKFHEVVDLYASEKNPEWVRLSANSKRIYGNGLQYLTKFNQMNIDEITRPMVIELRDELYDRAGTCRTVIITLSNVLRYAYDRGWVEYNHARGVRGMPARKEIESWSDAEIDAFMKVAPEPYQRAVMLALYTGQRRGDLVKIAWDDYDGRYIKVRQQKTGAQLIIPVHKNLKAILDPIRPKPLLGIGRLPGDSKRLILTNCHGDRWNVDSLTRGMRRLALEAGVPLRSLHGLRKSAAEKLAEAGCTPHQIMSITGHATLSMVSLYTKRANQTKLAQEAMDRWDS